MAPSANADQGPRRTATSAPSPGVEDAPRSLDKDGDVARVEVLRNIAVATSTSSTVIRRLRRRPVLLHAPGTDGVERRQEEVGNRPAAIKDQSLVQSGPLGDGPRTGPRRSLGLRV